MNLCGDSVGRICDAQTSIACVVSRDLGLLAEHRDNKCRRKERKQREEEGEQRRENREKRERKDSVRDREIAEVRRVRKTNSHGRKV